MDTDELYAILGSEILALLRRAHAGEDPDLLLVEVYANSEDAE